MGSGFAVRLILLIAALWINDSVSHILRQPQQDAKQDYPGALRRHMDYLVPIENSSQLLNVLHRIARRKETVDYRVINPKTTRGDRQRVGHTVHTYPDKAPRLTPLTVKAKRQGRSHIHYLLRCHIACGRRVRILLATDHCGNP